MKKLSVLLAAVLLMTAVDAASLPNGRVIISGKLLNVGKGSSRVLIMHFSNPFKPRSTAVRIDERNEFRVEGDMTFAQDMTLFYGNQIVVFYVMPGDSVHLTIDIALLDDKQFAWLNISGDHARLSDQLTRWCNFSSAFITSTRYDYSLSPRDMLAAIRKDYDRCLLQLKEYADKNQLDDTIRKWAERDMLYEIGNHMSDYFSTEGLTWSQKKERIMIFRDPVFAVDDPSNFKAMIFSFHLAAYSYCLVASDSAIAHALSEERYWDAAIQGAAILMKEPANLSRDYMMFSYLGNAARKISGFNERLEEMKKYFIEPAYFDHLKAAVQRLSQTAFKSTASDGIIYMHSDGKQDSLPVVVLLDHVRKKHPGKVVYIDMYATWCGPCRTEIQQYVPELHEYFRDKDVVFVNVCAGSRKSSWIKILTELNMTGENYFLNDDAGMLFRSDYGLEGYPSYLLMDRSGRLVTSKAPRPMDKKLVRRVITGLLEKTLDNEGSETGSKTGSGAGSRPK